MASDKKKILMFDESTGMLSKEVMLAYIYGELSPSLRQDVDTYLSENEMHRDIIEGLRQLENPNQIEKAIHAINERVGQRSGAQASSSGASFEMPEFSRGYGKIAAALAGVLLLSGIIFTIIQNRQPSGEVALTEKADETQNARKRVKKPQPPARQEQPVQTIAGNEIKDTVITTEALEDTIAAGNSIAYNTQVSAGTMSAFADNSKPEEEKADLKKKEPAITNPSATKTSPAAGVAKDTALENKNFAMNARQADVTAGAINSAAAVGAVKTADDMNFVPPVQQEQSADKDLSTLEVQDANTAEVQPQFPGGEAALQQFIRSNLKYPPAAKEQGIEGKVYVSFWVGTSGRVKDIKVVKGINKEINAEAIRLISNMPAWTPGTQKGKAVAMTRLVIIDFKVE